MVNAFTNKTSLSYKLKEDKVSKILDAQGNVVYEINLTKDNNISYNDLPDVFINALISSEDARFYSHTGIDLQRIVSSLVTNITNNKSQGASTLTQQLIKNTLLDTSKTLDRKLNEIIISLKLEKELSKEDILEAYCNNILFDGVSIGVNNASLKLFNKSINNVTLSEAALLAGIVNAPSLYNPFKNPDKAKERMDVVLSLMFRHGYISENELNKAKMVQIKDILNPPEPYNETYKYQAFLDIVYKQTTEILNDSYLTKPLIIETTLNKDVQNLIDDIQKGKIIKFSDDNQQFALALIDNETGALVASMGGRNYNGKLLFNRSYDMKNQPASTIKPLLSYALGIENLHYNSKQVLNDIPTTYSNGNPVNNVDLNYSGEILIEDAIGYSKNTIALSTLQKVISLKGASYVSNYLSKINLLDSKENEFNEAYALGAFKYGVSPYNLAAAYSLIPNKGYYKEPYTIKKIIDSTTNKVLYQHTDKKNKVLETSTTDILTSILKNVVDKNYYGLGSLKFNDSSLYVKTGTSSFDSTTLKKYNYPNNSSKDIWLAGFNKQYSFAIWSGFDLPKKGEENYFKVGSDIRKNYHKQILKLVLQKATITNEDVTISDAVSKVNIVKGTNLLPNALTPSYLITEAYFKKGYEPSEIIKEEPLTPVNDISFLIYEDFINVVFNDYSLLNLEKENTIYSNDKIYGDIEFVVEINGITHVSDYFDFNIDNINSFVYNIKAYTRYKNAKEITSNIYYKEFIYI